MNSNQQPVVMIEDDYNLLKPYIGRMPDGESDMSLAHELTRAIIVQKEAFPRHGVRLNSRVSILELKSNKVLEFTIVMPEHADIRENKISVLTPMGTALIGFRKAEEVQWSVPGGMMRFRILDVFNRP